MKNDQLTQELANTWIANANLEKDRYSEPVWKWDYGFKLDFDGPIVCISSRFYPIYKSKGITWNGDMCVIVKSREVLVKTFEADTLDELRAEVEAFVERLDFKLTIKD